ncbi:hypothetical protein [Pectobacterium brasiliense]|nr:hypothetical protein [Pectobacterium brasiliense]ATV45822.1 hypothetical protein CTV95_21460 [Pectobacterium brasiliense]MCH4990960.1 hypothetical protein [Pectobacterium brasiliense]
MIIQIDSSAHIFCIHDKSHDSTSFIEDLCSSRKLGYIELDSSKDLLLGILERSDLSQLQKAIIKNIKEEITFNLALFEEIKFRAVVFHSENNFDNSKYNNQNIFIDIKNYYDRYSANGINPFEKPKLVLEDINDYKVYSYICNWYKRKNGVLAEQKLSLDVEHGGGARTTSVCENYFSAGKIVFSICDSDAKYPGDTTNHKTATDLKDLFSKKININYLYVLNCQEVENLIPFSILKQIANKTQLPAINFIEHIVNVNPDYYFFIDLKNGFKYNSVFPMKDTPYSVHWGKLFENFNCEYYKSELEKIKSKESPSNASIICKLSSMLPHAIEKMSISPIDIEIEPYLIEEWTNIARKLYSWGCAGKKLRVL